MNPSVTSQVAAEQRRDMLAQGARERQARQAVAQARELQRSERRARRAARLVLRLRAGLEQ